MCRVFIQAGDTITIDDAADVEITLGKDSGPGSDALTINGTLIYPHTATVDHKLIMKGDIEINSTGALSIGNYINPIPIDRKFEIELGRTSHGISYHMTADDDADISMWGAEMSYHRDKLASTHDAGLSSITTSNSTNWRADDWIVIAPRRDSESYESGTEKIQIDSVVDTTVNLKTPLSYKHAEDAEVINITRNVAIYSYDNSVAPYASGDNVTIVCSTGTSDAGSCSVGWVELYNLNMFRVLYCDDLEFVGVSVHESACGLNLYACSNINIDKFVSYYIFSYFFESSAIWCDDNNYGTFLLNDFAIIYSDGYGFDNQEELDVVEIANGVFAGCIGWSGGVFTANDNVYIHDVDAYSNRCPININFHLGPNLVRMLIEDYNAFDNECGIGNPSFSVGGSRTPYVQLINVTLGTPIENSEYDIVWPDVSSTTSFNTSVIMKGENVSMNSTNKVKPMSSWGCHAGSISLSGDTGRICVHAQGSIMSADMAGYRGKTGRGNCLVMTPTSREGYPSTVRYLHIRHESGWFTSFGTYETPEFGLKSFVIPASAGVPINFKLSARRIDEDVEPTMYVSAYGCGINYPKALVTFGDYWYESSFSLGTPTEDGFVDVLVSLFCPYSEDEITPVLVDDILPR